MAWSMESPRVVGRLGVLSSRLLNARTDFGDPLYSFPTLAAELNPAHSSSIRHPKPPIYDLSPR
jgi:hypothetical protein